MLLKLLFAFFLFNQPSWAQSFYPKSYQEGRSHFLKLTDDLHKQFPKTKKISLPVPTRTGVDLTMNAVYISQMGGKTDRLLILSSGIHGVEAFTGSAIQSLFIKKHLNQNLLEKTGVLIVHAVNPYGFHFHRRVSENNVDLNRNFSTSPSLYGTINKSYMKLNRFLNPLDKLDSGHWATFKLFISSIFLLVEHGKKSFTQAVVGGQYQNERGIYFGGHQEEPNKKIIEKLFSKYAHPYKMIFHIDLHTGYGQRGTLHLFSTSNLKEKTLKLVQTMFEDQKMDYGEDKDFYLTTGEFTSFTVQKFPNKSVIPMTFEFGTMDSQTILGSFHSLKNSIYENQGYQFGYVSEESKIKAQKNFLEMFNPSDEVWRTQALKTADEKLKLFTQRFSTLAID